MKYGLRGKRVWVAGHHGMVGAAIHRRLMQEDCTILTVPRCELDLERQDDVKAWVDAHKPEVVFLAAARVGGIHANMTYPVDFLLRNLQIETNVMDAVHRAGVEKCVFLGSSCIYPRDAVQPITEHSLLTGALEPTNEFYAIAKIAGIKLCTAYRRQYGMSFISLMPTNLYGPGDNFDVENGHVPAALMMRCHAAKQQGDAAITLWGTGTPLREFLYVDDLADAAVFLAQHYDDELPINVGSRVEISIRDFAQCVANVVGFQGEIICDTSRPDGTPRKLLDCTRLTQLGWRATTPLTEGLGHMYADYCARLLSGDCPEYAPLNRANR